MPASHSLFVHKFRDGQPAEARADMVATEAPLQISILQHGRQRQVSITMRTPGNDVELALGFLFTEGILSPDLDPETVSARHLDEQMNHLLLELPSSVAIDWQRLSRQTYTSSSCGVCGKTSIEQVFTTIPWGDSLGGFKVARSTVTALPERLRKGQKIFTDTGGVHACGIFDLNGELLEIYEDVGRHNAFDKIAGKLWMSKIIPCFNLIVVLSGRASFELIQKAGMSGFRFIVAVGAPSSLAVELADELGITLCGFVRKQTFNCYSGYHRIS
ncbi:formate dehydrogenase family accessory protein FdhD [Lewinellaceae bacterium SD302]|nr:formate dehydrogenase family accessory protein FdhD [Lewinellaceae bacterium SD302]